MSIEAVPLVAWEQAVIVVLFAVLIASMFGLVLSFFAKREKEWQAFIVQRDNAWRDWMDRNQTANAGCLAEITGVLRQVANDLREHDSRVDELFSHAMQEVRQASGKQVRTRDAKPKA